MTACGTCILHTADRHAQKLPYTERHCDRCPWARPLRRKRVHIHEQGQKPHKAAALGTRKNGHLLQAA